MNLLNENDIGICGLQEAEVPMNFPENILDCGGYVLELELNNEKKRAGFYIRNDISYIRRLDLEMNNVHVLVVDIDADVKFCVINVYRSFRPQGSLTAEGLFEIRIYDDFLS